MLFEILGQVLAGHRINDAFHLGVVELAFGLRFELRVRQADRNDGRQASRKSSPVGTMSLKDILLLAVGVERAGQGGAEADDVRAAVNGIYVIYIAVDVLGVLRGNIGRATSTSTDLSSL